MVLADTSVWIQHFRHGEPALAGRLVKGLVLMHPFVSGELACGNLRNRAAVLSDLQTLPPAKEASNAEVLWLLEDRRLGGEGWAGSIYICSLRRCYPNASSGHSTSGWCRRVDNWG